jgi:hypothetical protein
MAHPLCLHGSSCHAIHGPSCPSRRCAPADKAAVETEKHWRSGNRSIIPKLPDALAALTSGFSGRAVSPHVPRCRARAGHKRHGPNSPTRWDRDQDPARVAASPARDSPPFELPESGDFRQRLGSPHPPVTARTASLIFARAKCPIISMSRCGRFGNSFETTTASTIAGPSMAKASASTAFNSPG